MEIKIERESSESCSTYFDTAKEIAKIPHPVGSPEWLAHASARVKRFGHHEKLSVYSRYKFHLKDGPQLEDFTKIKIETHSTYVNYKDEEIMNNFPGIIEYFRNNP
jgi:hypothetical protein